VLKFLIPLVLFGLLAAFLYRGLSLNPREVPSPLIGRPAPEFSLPRLDDPGKTVTSADFKGKVWVLNVWASWCAPCREEHPLVIGLARKTKAPIVGLNYKDQPMPAQAWLKQLGDPYAVTLFDFKGEVGIDFGVYGVPETFVIDAQGQVRYKHTGPLTPKVLAERIEPLLKDLGV
jgi:cytochrome c biogenesis protein CcmG/thiol:disulfide interchange protein DsbE